MRSEAPQDVFLGAYFADVQTIGVQIVDLSQCAVVNQLLQFQDRRMVPENVSNH